MSRAWVLICYTRQQIETHNCFLSELGKSDFSSKHEAKETYLNARNIVQQNDERNDD